MKKINFFAGSLFMLVALQNAAAEDLISIYKKAMQADPSLRAAQYKVALGEAQRGQAGGELLPQINANVNLSMNDRSTTGFNDDSYTGERYSVGLTQSVIDLPKYWNWERSKEVAKQYQAENLDVEQTLMLDVVERYFNALEARDTLFLIQQERDSTRTQLQQLKKQYKKQIIKITDVLEVEAKLNNLEADEIEAETKFIIAKESLVELTGEKVELLDQLKVDIQFSAIEGNMEQWIEQAKNINPALQAKNSSIEAAKNDVAQQKSRHLPVVDIQLNYYFTDTGFQSSQQPESETQVAALNMNIPIFSGGTTTRRSDEAAQKLEIQKQENIAMLRDIIKQTRDSFLSTNASLRRIKAARKGLESSTKSRQAMEKGFQYGVQTISDVLLSQSREFRSKRDLLQARYQYIKSKMWFYRITGKINEESLQEINAWLQPVSVSSK